jgi:hypothetical protein
MFKYGYEQQEASRAHLPVGTRLEEEVLFRMHLHSSPGMSFVGLWVQRWLWVEMWYVALTPTHQQETIMLESSSEEEDPEGSGGGTEPHQKGMSWSILRLLLHISSLINKCIHSYADLNVRRERVQELEKMDKEIKYNEALAKRVACFVRKEPDEKVERGEKEEASRKKEASCSKNEATKDMVS